MDPFSTAAEAATQNEQQQQQPVENVNELMQRKPAPSWYGPRMAEAQRLLDERRAARMKANDSYGFSDYAADIAKAPARGAEGALKSITNIATKPVRWALSKAGVADIPDWEERTLGRSKTTAGGIIEGITQFLTGSIVTGGAAGAVAKSLGAAAELAGAGVLTKTAATAASGLTEATVAAGAARGAITDFSAFGAHEERLSNLIQEFPSLSNPVTQYLEAKDDDNEAEGRLKNAVEGLIVGSAAEVVLKTLRAFRKSYARILKGADGLEVNKVMSEELHAKEFQDKVKQALEEQELKNTTANEAATSDLAPDLTGEKISPITESDVRGWQEAKKELSKQEKQNKALSAEFQSSFDPEGPLPSAINFRTFGNTDTDFQNLLSAAGKTVENRFKTKAYGSLKEEGHAMAADVIERMSDSPEEATKALKLLSTAGEEQVKAVVAAGDVMNSATFGLQNHIDSWLNPGPLKNMPTWNRGQIDEVLGRYLRTMGEARKIKSYSGMALQANKATKRRYFTAAEKQALMAEKEALKERTIKRLKAEGKYTEGISNQEMLKMDEQYARQLEALDNAAKAAKNEIDLSAKQKADAAMEAELAQKTSTLLKLSDEELKQVLVDMQTLDDPSAAAKLLHDATTRIDPSNFKQGYETLLKYQRASLLSRIPTHVTNIVGGLFNQGILMGQRALGGELRGALRQLKGTVYSTLEASKLAWQAFKHGPILEATSTLDKPMRGFKVNRKAFSNTLFGDAAYYAAKALNVPFRMLVASDEFLKQTSARGFLYADFMERGEKAGLKGAELNQFVSTEMAKAVDARGRFWNFDNTMKAGYEAATIRGITERSERFKFATRYAEEKAATDMTVETLDGIERAKQFGQTVTFQNPLDPSSFHGRLGGVLQNTPVVNLVFPFYKTPINIFKQAFRNTPVLGQVIDTLTKEFTHANPERAAMARGRTAQAMLMLPTVMALTQNGTITGHGPTNPRERALLMETGWRPYSLKIGNEYLSYLRFDPLSTPIGLIADITEHWNNGHEANDLNRLMATTLSALTWNIGSRSYLKGLSDLMSFASNPTTQQAQNLTKSLASPLVPGVFKDIKMLVEQNVADPMKDVRTIADAWIDRIPYGEKLFGHIIDKRYNALGEPANKNIGGAIEKATSMIARSELTDDKLMQELAAINASIGRPGHILGGPGGVDLRRIRIGDQSAYGRYQELTGTVRVQGKTLRQALVDLTRSSEYRKLSDEKIETENGVIVSPKENKIRQVVRVYREKAREQLQREIPQVRKQVQTLNQLKKGMRKGQKTASEVRRFINSTN